MDNQQSVPLYATVLYDVRKQLNISWLEYIYLDMVQKLHIHQRWCTKSLVNCADDLGISKRGVSKLKERLIQEGLLEKNARGNVRVTPKYTEVSLNKVPIVSNTTRNKVPSVGNKVPSGREQSSHKSYNRTTLENSSKKIIEIPSPDPTNVRGKYSPAKELIKKQLYEKRRLVGRLSL